MSRWPIPTKLFVCAALAVAFLCGCASAPPKPMAHIEPIGSGPEVVVVGPADDVNPYGGTYRKWLLRSFVNKRSHTVSTQLYVDIGYVGGWRRYNVASDASNLAAHLSVEPIGSHVDTCFGKGVCSLDETIGIQLDDAQLQAHAQLGYAISISAKSGESLTIAVEPDQIDAQLSALAKFGRLSPVAPPAVSPAASPTASSAVSPTASAAASPRSPLGGEPAAQLFSTTTSLICSTGERSVYLGMSPRISPAWGPKPA